MHPKQNSKLVKQAKEFAEMLMKQKITDHEEFSVISELKKHKKITLEELQRISETIAIIQDEDKIVSFTFK